MASKAELQTSLLRYEEALTAKSNQLLNLDDWFRKELQSTVESRKASDDGAYITTTELAKLMKWKLTRGKFRPRLEQLAASNPDEVVKNVTRDAFSLLIDSTSIETAKQSLLKLNTLKGIGPATSSAILSLFSPDSMPFMSDEALKFAAGLNEKPKYNVKEWEWFVGEMRARRKKEGWSGTDELEKAAWSFAILKIYEEKNEIKKKRKMDVQPTTAAKRQRR